jgi:hypothetical protein
LVMLTKLCTSNNNVKSSINVNKTKQNKN